LNQPNVPSHLPTSYCTRPLSSTSSMSSDAEIIGYAKDSSGADQRSGLFPFTRSW
jgi:hypothetical protein